MMMMKTSVILVVSSSLISTSLAATAIGLSALSKDFRNQCIDDVSGKPHRLHSSWPMKQECGQHTCVKYANELYIQYETCGYMEAAVAPCRVVENPEASYPECCPRIVCDEQPAIDNNNVNNDNNVNNNFNNIISNLNNVNTISDKVDNSLINEINIDDYGHYDELSDQLFMMSSYDAPSIMEDYFLSGDEISDMQHPEQVHEPVEYMVDWDTLFANY